MVAKLQIGHYLKGPEPYGCFNTGRAPVIARSKKARKYIGKEYIVGHDLDVLYNMTDLILQVMRGQKIKAKLFTTPAPAWREFNRLVAQIEDSNQQERHHVTELKSNAAKGNMAAVLELGDY